MSASVCARLLVVALVALAIGCRRAPRGEGTAAVAPASLPVLPPVTSRAPGCTPSGVCWVTPTPQGNHLFAIAGTSASDVWFGGAHGTLLHFDGHEIHAVDSATTADIKSLYAPAPDDLWVAEPDGDTTLRFDGSTFVRVSGPASAVAGLGAADVWMAPNPVGKSLIRFDGHAFLPVPWTGAPYGFVHIAVAAPDNAWITGNDGQLYHSAGTGVTRVPLTGSAYAVFARAPDDVWVACLDGRLLRSRGSGFAVVAATGRRLLGVWAAAADDVWMASDEGTLLRWNGAALLPVASGTNATLFAIWGSSASDVWAGGEDGTLLHFDGRAVAAVSHGEPASFAGLARTGDGAFLLAGSDAAGKTGRLVRVEPSGRTSELPLPRGTARLTAVSAAAPGDLWIAGAAGALVRSDGHAARTVPSGVSADLASVWASDRDDVWAVGAGGVVLHWDGRAVHRVPAPTTEPLLAVAGCAEDDIWMVGEGGIVLHWDGRALVPVDSGISDALRAVGCVAAGAVWIAGDVGFVLRGGPAGFTAFPPGISFARLTAVWGRAPDDVWVAGESGTLLHFDGAALTPIHLGTSVHLFAITSDGRTVWVAGSGGALLAVPDPSAP